MLHFTGFGYSTPNCNHLTAQIFQKNWGAGRVMLPAYVIWNVHLANQLHCFTTVKVPGPYFTCSKRSLLKVSSKTHFLFPPYRVHLFHANGNHPKPKPSTEVPKMLISGCSLPPRLRLLRLFLNFPGTRCGSPSFQRGRSLEDEPSLQPSFHLCS